MDRIIPQMCLFAEVIQLKDDVKFSMIQLNIQVYSYYDQRLTAFLKLLKSQLNDVHVLIRERVVSCCIIIYLKTKRETLLEFKRKLNGKCKVKTYTTDIRCLIVSSVSLNTSKCESSCSLIFSSSVITIKEDLLAQNTFPHYTMLKSRRNECRQIQTNICLLTLAMENI